MVLKGEGAAHKSDAGLVMLNLGTRVGVEDAARNMDASAFLVEAMVAGGLAEILVGVTADPAHGFVLTLGAGGTLTELIHDSVSLMVPASADEISSALHRLRIAPLLQGHRGAQAVDEAALVGAVLAVQSYVEANAAHVVEVEVNPVDLHRQGGHCRRCAYPNRRPEMTDTPIRTDRRGHVLEVTLDRPKANAIDLATSRIMGEVFTAFRDDPECRVAIITGAGEKFFCPGWDLKARRRRRCGGWRLWQGRVRRLAGIARAQ